MWHLARRQHHSKWWKDENSDVRGRGLFQEMSRYSENTNHWGLSAAWNSNLLHPNGKFCSVTLTATAWLSSCSLEGFVSCSRRPKTELCAKSKTLSLEPHILFSEYRKWQVRILGDAATFLIEDSLVFPQGFQPDAGTILKSGPNHFLSLPLQFITSIRYRSIVRCCSVTVIGSIVK